MSLKDYQVIQNNTYERTINNKVVRIFKTTKKVSVQIVDIISKENLQFIASDIQDAEQKIETFIK